LTSLSQTCYQNKKFFAPLGSIMAHQKTHRYPIFLALAVGVVLSSSPTQASPKGSASAKPTARAGKAVARVGQPVARTPRQLHEELSQAEGFEGLERVVQPIRSGDKLPALLVRMGLSQPERQSWLRSMQKQLTPQKFSAGKEIHFYFKRAPVKTQVPGKRSLAAIEIELGQGAVLSWEKGTGGIVFSKRSQPQETEVKAVSGVVESSFFEDGQKLGLSSGLISQLADIFSWEIDFDREIQQGDTFKLVYEERSQKGKEEKRSFRILAAELMSSGKKHFAVYFEKKKGQGNYYDLYGQSLARAFLRFPLEFNRVSSSFSEVRYHPILKEDRPHYGVDFAAARGTPVRAVGDGKVRYSGWRKGGYGRLVEVSHGSDYGTRYAHLQRLARGIRKGVQVKKGQIIGYVGSSGRSTGPHLHFELYRDGERLDPLKFEYPPEDSIDPALLRVFEDAKQLLIAELAAAQSS